MTLFACHYLAANVELTDERAAHIESHHPELLPDNRDRLAEVIADPDEIRRDNDYPNTRLFFRWYDDVRGGKYIVVVVVSDHIPTKRHWIVTAFLARKPPLGELEWKRR